MIADLIKALQIAEKYTLPNSSQDKWPTWCSHDELHLTIDPSKFSDEDLMAMEELGFIVEGDESGFVSFKYGSA